MHATYPLRGGFNRVAYFVLTFESNLLTDENDGFRLCVRLKSEAERITSILEKK